MTAADLFERAIAWELEARDLYTILADAFPAHPLVEEVWQTMAADESSHATILSEVRHSLPPSQLEAPLPDTAANTVRSIEEELATARTAPLRTLDDAYELAHALESSEINAVFQLLVLDRMDDASRRAVVTTQLHDHIDRLDIIRRNLDRSSRQQITVEVPFVG